MNADDTRLVIAHTSSGAEALAKKVRKADVVSAFSTIPSEVLFDVFDAKRRTRRRPSLVYCGDDQHAKDVAELWRITTSASRAIIHPLYLAAGPPITSLAHVDPSEARRGVGGAVTLARAPRKT